MRKPKKSRAKHTENDLQVQQAKHAKHAKARVFDDPFAEFTEWASAADEQAYASLSEKRDA